MPNSISDADAVALLAAGLAVLFCALVAAYWTRRERRRYPDAAEELAVDEKAERNERRLKRLREMPYEQYLESAHWMKVRQRALRMAGHKCQRCGRSDYAAEGLEVHHLTYERRGCEDPVDLMAVCRKCHAKIHHKPFRPLHPWFERVAMAVWALVRLLWALVRRLMYVALYCFALLLMLSLVCEGPTDTAARLEALLAWLASWALP